MVIISEIISVTGLIAKADGFLFRIPDNWYKGNSEIKSFQSELSILSQRSTQWDTQLKHHGMSEDPRLTSFLAEASKLLDEEEHYYDAHRKSPLWKFRRKLFPGKLTYILTRVCKLVEAGPQLLKEGVETDDLLTKKSRTRASDLPFAYDPQYVPLQSAVEEVREALEDVTGPEVVTLHGEPGLGKSALAKHIALLYQDLIRGSATSSFDSVQYLFCGRGCQASTRQLQMALLSNLGLGAILQVGTSEDERDGEYRYSLSSYQSTLRRVLRDRRVLFILDDVWEEDFEVLACIISRGSGCRYLLTSQTTNVWPHALRIQIPTPTEEEALNIFYNHLRGYSHSPRGLADSHSLTGGSSRDSHHDISSNRRHTWRPPANTSLHASSSGSQPEASSTSSHPGRLSSKEQTPFLEADLKGQICELMKILQSHPLSLVNVAVSVSRNGAVDENYLRALVENIFTFLDKNRHAGRILVNERPYSLTVSASMMLMVNSLCEAERDVLFLIALLRRDINSVRLPRGVPEGLVRFFIRRLYRGSALDAVFDYSSALRSLEDNSLVQIEGDTDSSLPVNSTLSRLKRISLSIHNLRREYIKRRHLMPLQGMASSIVAADLDPRLDVRSDHGLQGSLVNVQDSGQCLAIAMGAVYFDDVFAEELALPFQSITAHMSSNESAIGCSSGHGQRFRQNLHSITRLTISDSGAVNGIRSVIPRGLDQLVDARELVRSARGFWSGYYQYRQNACNVAFKRIIELLNLVEDPEEQWEQQVHFDASKVMMRLLCRKELDDSSMASLLTIPHVMVAACVLFNATYNWLYQGQLECAFFHGEQQKALSDTLPATWRASLNLVYDENVNLSGWADNGQPLYGSRANIIRCLLEFEPEDRVLVELQRLREVADATSNPYFQNDLYNGFLYLHVPRLTWQTLSGSDLQELLPVILWKTIIDHLKHVGSSLGDNHVYSYADLNVHERDYELNFVGRFGLFMRLLQRDSGYVQKLLTVPCSWRETLTNPSFFRQLLKLEARTIMTQDIWTFWDWEPWLNLQNFLPPEVEIGVCNEEWLSLLSVLSGTTQFQAEAGEVLNEAYWAEEDFSSWPESSSMKLARFWSNVALLPSLTDSIRLGLVKIAKCWMTELHKYNHDKIICSSFSSTGTCPVHGPCKLSDNFECNELLQRIEEVTRAVTIISVLHDQANYLLATETSGLEGSQERWTETTLCDVCGATAGLFYLRICKGQTQAYCQMEKYDEALSYLDLAETACSFVHAKWTALDPTYSTPEQLHTYFRSHGVLIQALSKNYIGAGDSLDLLEEAVRLLADSIRAPIERDHHWQFFMCTNRGVLFKLSGEFLKAIHKFDESLEHCNNITSDTSPGHWEQFWGNDQRIHNFVKCRLLEHLSHAKELMQDIEGSKLDMETAKGLRSSSAFLEPVTWRETFAFSYADEMWIKTLEYSLLQLPAN